MLTWGFRPPSGVAGADWKPTFLMEKVLEHFTWFPDPQSAEQLANAILGKREYVVKAVEALVADGRRTKDSAGEALPANELDRARRTRGRVARPFLGSSPQVCIPSTETKQSRGHAWLVHPQLILTVFRSSRPATNKQRAALAEAV